MLNEDCQVKIKQITQKQVWEGFLMWCGEKTFLDSWNWGEFQEKTGNKIWRLGIFRCLNLKFKHLIGTALVVRIKAKRGAFLFIPHGPVIKVLPRPVLGNSAENGSRQSQQVLQSLLKELRKIAKQENCSFIRIAPIFERDERNIKIFKECGFRDAPIHMHPESTWELDIALPEDELLMNMRKTTRYLIRQAQKNKDIEIIQSNEIEALEKFNQIYQDTKDRHHFTPFSINYLKNEFLSFAPENQISIFLGKYSPPHQKFGSGGKNEIISSAMIIFWQGIGFYHQGASSLKYPKIPVSYLLQWEAIKEAKRRGCKIYNFWGIAPISFDETRSRPKGEVGSRIINKKHPWAGLTLFKMGFGGHKKEYVKTQDLVLSPKYWLNYIVEKIRKKKRGL